MTTFITRETYNEMRELPIARKSAAQALYSARKGNDNALKMRYVRALSATLASTAPKMIRMKKRGAQSSMAPIAMEKINEI